MEQSHQAQRSGGAVVAPKAQGSVSPCIFELSFHMNQEESEITTKRPRVPHKVVKI